MTAAQEVTSLHTSRCHQQYFNISTFNLRFLPCVDFKTKVPPLLLITIGALTQTRQASQFSYFCPCSFFCFCVFKVRCDVKVIQNMLDIVPFFDFMFLLVSVLTALFPVYDKIRSSYGIMVHCYRLNYTAKRSQIK